MLLRFGCVVFAVAACIGLSAHSQPMSPTLRSTPAQPSLLITADALPPVDQRAVVPPHTLDTPRTFPVLVDRATWEARRERIRQQVLVSCGLYPLPPKTPLKAKIFGHVERDGYTIEKVYFQTYPGFYLAGNLYRPGQGVGSRVSGVGNKSVDTPLRRASGRPPTQSEGHGSPEGQPPNAQHPTPDTRHPTPHSLHPGILIAHGHWSDGRMADGPDGSIAARAITFARQGCVAFTYDMVGYNDTRQIPQHRTFAADRQHWLWGISLMGLQTWNSVRALDFLAALPDVDTTRLAITGESGGGTQTMMLGAIDDRLAAASPCVMVSHSMQGGCLCENAPGLRIDFSNMELAAAFAPKPQVMVGATGDWTQTMMTVQGPAVASVYNLYQKPDNLKYVIFPFNHNINKTSRDAVYRFFGKTLLHDPNADTFTEPPYQREAVADLRVFPDDKPLPSDAKTPDQLTQYLKAQGEAQLEKAKPHDRRSLTQFKKTFQPAWERTLALEVPAKEQLSAVQTEAKPGSQGYTLVRSRLGRNGRGDSIPTLTLKPLQATTTSVILLHPQGSSAFMQDKETPGPLVRALLAKGQTVVLPDLFLTGERADGSALYARRNALDDFGQFFTTYNRTDLQERVQDIVTVCAYLHKALGAKVTLVGMEQAGLWAMLAAPAADAVVADCSRVDLTTDAALLTDDLYVPCLRRMGDFRTALTLAAPHPLLLHNTGANFPAAAWVREVYAAVGATPSLQSTPDRLNEDALVSWLTAQAAAP